MSFIPPDTLRVVALAGLFPAAVLEGVIGTALTLLVLGACMIPRALGTPPTLDALYCGVLIFAAWAALLDWYVAVSWLDLVVHALTTGLIGIIAWQVVNRGGILMSGPSPVQGRVGALVGVTACATLLAVLWEIGEWLGHTHLDPSIQVGYVDTITDLVAGMVGALLAGIAAVSVSEPSMLPADDQQAVR